MTVSKLHPTLRRCILYRVAPSRLEPRPWTQSVTPSPFSRTSRVFFASTRSFALHRRTHWYATNPFDEHWKQGTSPALQADSGILADELARQNRAFHAGDLTLANIERLRQGARAVVTGQQVGLFGGPLLTLLKAATAIRKAQVASAAGVPHVPVFWMATEDHDLDEVNRATLLSG